VNDEDLERRIIDLEIRLTHQDRLLEELNDVVIEQRRLIDDLRGRVERLERGGEADEAGDL
jgi:SlyX protein